MKQNILFCQTKAISPVIAIALLLVVAIISVVSFQGWFDNYSSDILSNTEIQSNSATDNTLSIETLSGNTLYIINNIEDNLSIIDLKIENNTCFITHNLSLGMNEINVAGCIDGISTTPNIALITTKSVISKTIFINDAAPLDCSTLDGGEWIKVPGNSLYNTNDFCVMKYEARNVGDIATSQAANNPWVSITWQEAKLKCENLGTNYRLISENEWLTIARLIENDATNWNSSVVGTGGIFRGNVNLNDNLSCGTNSVLSGDIAGTNCLIGSRNKRTLNISGELIWDLSGNVWEWVDDWVYANSTLGSPYRYHGGNQEWMSYNNDDGSGKIASLIPALKVPYSNWNADNGIGRYYDGYNINGTENSINEPPDNCTGYCSHTAVFLRGGSWTIGKNAGVFALGLLNGYSYLSTYRGFRCTYAP